jgi:ribosome recycling factor
MMPMTIAEQTVKDLETALAAVTGRTKQDFLQVRGNKPSAEMVQDIRLSIYDQMLSIRELGSLNILPPRTIQITLWDPSAVPAVMKAIENAHLGLSTTNDGQTIRATLSPLGNERREELGKLVGKMAENARIQVRARREEAMKKLKDAKASSAITEDDEFKGREKVQKATEKANGEIEALLKAKLSELGE